MKNLSKYTEIFITDSREGLREMNQLLLHLEKDARNTELINNLFRKVHSLKGMAKMMEYHRLSELCHAMEEPLDKMREGQSFLTPEMIGLLFHGLDLLEHLVDEAVTASPPKIDYQGFLKKLKGESLSEETPAEEHKPLLSYKLPQAIPVDTQKLDDLISIVGEMILKQNRLLALNDPLASPELEEEIRATEKLISELYSKILSIRMVPVHIVTGMLNRLVRDLATAQGKEIEFQIEGDKEIKLDNTILDELLAPLIHLIRNAVDHGIEPAAQRQKEGKPQGKITLWFFKEKDSVTIEVEDNGQGVNPAKIKQEALKKGLVSRKKADSLTDEEVLTLLCTPGFSTSQKVTDISGRGVGLDVVKEKVDRLSGTMQLCSNYGMNTKFILKIPTTSHILFALLVKLNSHLFAIPLSKIAAIAKVDSDAIPEKFSLQADEVALVRLKDRLQTQCVFPEKHATVPVVVCEVEEKKVGFIVDGLVKIEQIFVRPLGKLLDRIDAFHGATILGDGKMALVLDIERLR